ncbi:transposase [Pasteurella testudinis DSM 23072]|uniref:Transposase n=2 Tax=Pasteurella testudinis TaxID=761 RepID=A0A1W1UGR3_9PAST|nr:transposase [Pasteurella testudinis]SMB80001.1 transposase [Pasteurella testudinis DSM 23072]SUB50623.1 Transposase [Pasteurella testudinis]
MNTPIYCGIDVAKKQMVIGFTHKAKTKTFTQNTTDIQHAVAYLLAAAPELIVMESTGGLEIPLAKALYHAGLRVIIANPRQTNQFALSQSLAKTDVKDAKMLACYAQMMAIRDNVEVSLYIPPSEEQQKLEATVKQRLHFVELRTAEKNRLQQIDESQRVNTEAFIGYLDNLIAKLDKDINEQHQHFSDKIELIKDIKGVGQNLTAVLMSMLPELGTLTGKQIASLVGVAPHPKESGSMKFHRRCWGGRKAVRNALYMSALVASRYEPAITLFYQRLLARGKPFKVAINACMRKLLTIINALVKQGEKWDSLRYLAA